MTSYYGRPVLKPPVWTWEVPWYFFTGGLAGASSMLAFGGRRAGNPELARAARLLALAGAMASPALLVSDLGRPERFHHMLRVFRPTSPLSLGSWVLVVYGPATGAAEVLARSGRLPRLQRTAEAVAAALGPVVATYTGVLVADTAIPVWHEARHELPFVFAGGALASAGGALAVVVAPGRASAARRTALIGAVAEEAAMAAMVRRLGDTGRPYREGRAGRFARAAASLTTAGAATLALAGRRRGGAAVGGALLLGGAVCTRWAVYRAGFQSVEHTAAR